MKILMVNKFLFPNGGSETYIFKLGDQLKKIGHDVQYFGMDHSERIVGNDINSYTSNMDFHSGKFSRLLYPFKIIYSSEARSKIKEVLEYFKPDIVHLNNFNFQLTPSIILEIRSYEKKCKKKIKIIFTAHDYQLVCPNHMMNNPTTHNNCEKCSNGNFLHCTKGKCIHNSLIKSLMGTIEGYFWKWKKVYKEIDWVICPSEFMKGQIDKNPHLSNKTIVMYNFIERKEKKEIEKKDYILYFGRYSEEKGIRTLVDVCKDLHNIKFLFAGKGPLERVVEGISNIKNLGFIEGDELENVIRMARFSIYPSEWYENCPFSVMESQMYGTPVLGANIGGIPELIKVGETGELFESKDKESLKQKIIFMWDNREMLEDYSKKCEHIYFKTLEEYTKDLCGVYLK